MRMPATVPSSPPTRPSQVNVQVARRPPAALRSGDELVRQTSDYFGWKRLGQNIRTALDGASPLC
jgi:hypothetical protein